MSLISIVIPALNEAGNIGPMYERIASIFDEIGCDWELIFVDDGSTDGTGDVLRKCHEQDARVKGICLTRSFGQGPAITAGIEAARGDAAIIMDADGQDPPEVIPAMIAKWREGFKVVGGHRIRREGQSVSKRLTAFLFYRVMHAMVGWELPVDTGEFRLMDRKVIEAVKACPQRDRLFRVLTSWTGFASTTVDYEQGIRKTGKTKYNLRKSGALAVTAVAGFSVTPLRVATWLGLFIIAASAVLATVLALASLIGHPSSMLAWVLVSVWFLGGVQSLILGVLGEYVGRAFREVQGRPIYVVRERVGIDN